MYICNCWEKTFEDCKIIVEHHPYGMTSATEHWAVCPYCEDTDYVEAKECEHCGEYVAELHEGLCDCCYGDMYGK